MKELIFLILISYSFGQSQDIDSLSIDVFSSNDSSSNYFYFFSSVEQTPTGIGILIEGDITKKFHFLKNTEDVDTTRLYSIYTLRDINEGSEMSESVGNKYYNYCEYFVNVYFRGRLIRTEYWKNEKKIGKWLFYIEDKSIEFDFKDYSFYHFQNLWEKHRLW